MDDGPCVVAFKPEAGMLSAGTFFFSLLLLQGDLRFYFAIDVPALFFTAGSISVKVS